MELQRNTSIRKSTFIVRLLIKLIVILLIIFFLFILVDRINFPSPNKKIEQEIPNETFKVLK